MAILCTAPATVLAVSLDDAREKIRDTSGDLDAQLELSLRGLIAETEHETGHCFMESAWRVALKAFPRSNCGEEPIIRVPHPVRAVQSVTYIDSEGEERLLPPSAYEAVAERYRSYIVPSAMSWPETAKTWRAVRIECTAGHGTDPAQTPDVARQYILARLELEYCPPLHAPTVEQLGRMLSSLTVYG